MVNANQVIVNGETILDLRSDTVTPETLQKGYTAHDKSGTKITGTLEASSSGGAKETWVLNNTVDTSKAVSFSANFVSNGLSYTGLKTGKLTPSGRDLVYTNSSGSTIKVYFADLAKWDNQAYRKITFDTPPTDDLLTWLQANGVKQPDDTAIQNSKALTITSNSTVSVTRDAPYDALKKVDVTIDVASGGGGGGETTSLTVNTDEENTAGGLYCLWQTSDGWMGTANFDSVTNFTIPNVIVGGCVIFTRDPTASELYFSAMNATGVEDVGVDPMDAKWDVTNGALVLRVTAPSPSFYLLLRT